MASKMEVMHNQMSPPYPPRYASIGLLPTNEVDTPITTIFMIPFLLTATIHMTLLQINFRRGQKFLMSGMAFGFSFSRVITCIMRIVWASYPRNIKIALAAQIFVAAGTILLFLINMIFTSRLLRAYHTWAWNPLIRWVFRVAYGSLFVGLVMIISVTIQTFFALDPDVLRIDRMIQLVISTYFAVYAFLPIPLLALRLILSPMHLVTNPKDRSSAEKFGTGRFRTKIRLLLFTSILLTLGAAFRAGTAYLPRKIDNPAWYHSKACFYVFDFGIDMVVLILYAVMRVDRRFIVPNGTKGKGDFRAGGMGGIPVKGEEGKRNVKWEWLRGLKGEWRVEGEEDIFAEREMGEDGTDRGGNTGSLETDIDGMTAVDSNGSGGASPMVVSSRENVDLEKSGHGD